MIGSLVAAALGSASVLAASPVATPIGCAVTLDQTVGTRPPKPVEAADLVGLRDMGSDIEFPGRPDPAFTISPDGTRIAAQVRRADPDKNLYCLSVFVVDLTGTVQPIIVDSGGIAQRWNFPALSGKADFPSGYARIIAPWWSADSRSLYFLKQTDGATQIWRAATDGSGSAPVTSSQADVADFALDATADRIVFSVRTGANAAARQIADEGRRGYRLDERSVPMFQVAPYPIGPLPLSYFVLNLNTNAVSTATTADEAFLARSRAGRINDAGAGLALEPVNVDRFPADTRLTAIDGHGRRVTCASTACLNIEPSFWWDADRSSVIFQTREGWARGETAFYRWTLSSGGIKRLFLDRGRFTACQLGQHSVICAYEAATKPRRVVSLDLDLGRMQTLFNPNAGFDDLTFGQVERLTWQTREAQAYGDLVYPTGFRPGVRYPLVVVQYLSRGFLRGGTGDEYPIQAFAGRGYFVLSTQNPGTGLSTTRGAHDYDDVARSQLKDFRRRREILGGIEQTIHTIIARGLVDKDRIGITGLSEGATGVQFAALHSRLFAAGAMSSCCWEPGQDALLGPSIALQYHHIGWPKLTDSNRRFWSQISWQLQPRKVRFPVLMQLADSEYLTALASFTALRQSGRPVELYVFPDEYHTRWHPAHRLATYQRALAWFDFWLKPSAAPQPMDASLRTSWLPLRSLQSKSLPISSALQNRHYGPVNKR